MSMIANAEDAASRLQKIATANSLDLPGKTPFHLKMSFQLYDLAGKSSDVGILEEWWSAPGQSRTTIIAASLKQSEPAVFDDSLVIDPRERYLVQELLQAETQPLPVAPPKSSAKLDEKSRKFDKTTLRCFDIPPLDDSLGLDKLGTVLPNTFCTDPATDTLLLEFSEHDGHTIARKDLGVFHESSIPLEVQVSYTGKLAIADKVLQVQSFDPLTSDVKLSPRPPDAKKAGSGQHNLVLAKPDKLVYADYPDAAARSNVTGVVVMSGLLTKLGTIKDIFTIASSGSILTGAAVEAFSKCKLKPFMLDGEPIEGRLVFESDFFVAGGSAGGVRVEGIPHSVPSPH